MKEFFGRLIAFLDRYVRSFFRRSEDAVPPPKLQDPPPPPPRPEPEPEAGAILPLPLLLNPAALDRVAFRREILDWRDNSIMQLDFSANTVLQEFGDHVVSLLNAEPIWRRAVPRKTNEVLADDFHKQVTLRIRAAFQKCDRQLDEIMGRWGRDPASRPRLIDNSSAKKIVEIANFGFKPANRKYILDAISAIFFGPEGFFDRYYQRISGISLRIVNEAQF